jgi:thioredoxin 1
MGEIAMAKPGEVTDESFEEKVIKADQPVMVDFWAPWCGPCRMVAPVVDELAEEYEGKATFLKMNTDDNPEVATKFGIRSIPTLLVFKDGKKVGQIIGFQPKNALRKRLDSAIA